MKQGDERRMMLSLTCNTSEMPPRRRNPRHRPAASGELSHLACARPGTARIQRARQRQLEHEACEDDLLVSSTHSPDSACLSCNASGNFLLHPSRSLDKRLACISLHDALRQQRASSRSAWRFSSPSSCAWAAPRRWLPRSRHQGLSPEQAKPGIEASAPLPKQADFTSAKLPRPRTVFCRPDIARPTYKGFSFIQVNPGG